MALFTDPPVGVWALPVFFQSDLPLACVVSMLPRAAQHDIADEMGDFVKSKGIPFFRPFSLQDLAFETEFFETKPTVIATMTFQTRIPMEILRDVPLGGINYHPALLPRYRGAVPYFWVILNGERETGVAIHNMTEEFDSGDIHFIQKLSVDPEETTGTLCYKSAQVGIQLMMKALQELKAGRPLPRTPQDSRQVTYARMPTAANLEINWAEKSEKILALIRAASPYFGADTYFRGAFLRIWSARKTRPLPGSILPGTLSVSQGKVEVAAGDAFIALETIQEGLLRFYSGQEFLSIPNLHEGERFGRWSKP